MGMIEHVKRRVFYDEYQFVILESWPDFETYLVKASKWEPMGNHSECSREHRSQRSKRRDESCGRGPKPGQRRQKPDERDRGKDERVGPHNCNFLHVVRRFGFQRFF